MAYGLFQYYNHELISWNRIIEFHKEESGEFVRQVTVAVDQQNFSSVPQNEKSNILIDQFIVQQREFDHIVNRIISQMQRLEKTASSLFNPIEHPICHEQDLLRSMMQRVEKSFNRAKYTCAIFLSLFLNDHIEAARKTRSQSPEYAA